MRPFILPILASLSSLVYFTPLTQEPDAPALRVPRNDCALVATEAYERLRAVGVWVRIVHLGLLFPNGSTAGHAVVVWQIFPGSRVCIYDEFLFHGTAELDTRSRSPQDIQNELNKHLFGTQITEISYFD